MPHLLNVTDPKIMFCSKIIYLYLVMKYSHKGGISSGTVASDTEMGMNK